MPKQEILKLSKWDWSNTPSGVYIEGLVINLSSEMLKDISVNIKAFNTRGSIIGVVDVPISGTEGTTYIKPNASGMFKAVIQGFCSTENIKLDLVFNSNVKRIIR